MKGVESTVTSLQPIETVQLGDRAFESIREAIVRTELPPGAPVKDRELAELLGLSRTPVREALHRLEAAGLLTPRGRGGWVVTPFSEQDVHELFELRRRLEPAGLDRLEEEPDDDAIERIATFFDGYQHPILPDRFDDYFGHDHSFHTFLVACSKNVRLQGFYTVIENHIVRGRHYLSSGVPQRIDDTLDEHTGIAEAVGQRDFELARQRLLAHLRTGEARMTEQLRQKLAAGG